MMKRRRRFRQEISLKERLATFAQGLREEASHLPAGPVKMEIARRLNKVEAAARFDEWLRSSELSRRNK
jgi:hypothetical protein